MNKHFDINIEKQEKIDRGERIRFIRENELRLSKSDLAKQIGVSSQFLGLVEHGKANLVYSSIKQLREISGHSADYILFGLDDSILNETKLCLNKYSDQEIRDGIKVLKDFSSFLKNKSK